ncbi:MAG: hypothetical protein U9R75_11500 [Candidatus Thermoplasmatota archaeon]|nr:hypothetical protein [Candidatus Thermoplasmatota archaeon]
MLKEYPLEETLLEGFEFPVAVVVEVTKQGIVLSKMRYLKAVGDVINQTIRCASIAMYAHVSPFVDPHLQDRKIGPVGIDLVYNFKVDKGAFNETVESIKRGRATINHNNPQTRDMALALIDKINKKERINYKRLSAQEQGLILEPYVYHLFCKAGSGRRQVLQNVELIDREGLLKCQVKHDVIRYKPAPAPTMELDILMFTDLQTLPSILKGLEEHGFRREL